MGTNRFYHVFHFSSGVKDTNEIDQIENNFNNKFHNDQFNFEQNWIDLNKIIVGLTDARRAALFDLCGQLVGSNFSLKKVDPQNELSVRYIDMDGQNVAVGSTGTRLLMTLLGLCMDDRFDVLFVDEPELGLGPRLQRALADFLQNPAERRQRFPHLKSVFVATHSHLFLDRNDFSNNFVVNKVGTTIRIARVESVAEFHHLQFNLLGNSLESMFFPAAIVVVEGKTDCEFISRLIQMRLPDRRVIVVHGAGDVKKKLHSLKEAFGDLARSPMRSRLFVVVDSVHPGGLESELIAMGLAAGNFVAWQKNGIEYYYPTEIMCEIYSRAAPALDALNITDDRVSLNGIEKTKNELKNDVLARLLPTSRGHAELETGLMAKLLAAIE